MTGARASDPLQLFSTRAWSYDRFIWAVRYIPGLRAFLMVWDGLRAGSHVLDAGCGTGALSLALREAVDERELVVERQHAFDLTPAMLDRFRHALANRRIDRIELAEANVLELERLPVGWTDYDLIVSASMLEYVPRGRLVEALSGLRGRLRPEGRFLLFMTKRNWLTKALVGWWWDSNLYTAGEIESAVRAAGYSSIAFRSFPLLHRHLALWGHIVEAHR